MGTAYTHGGYLPIDATSTHTRNQHAGERRCDALRAPIASKCACNLTCATSYRTTRLADRGLTAEQTPHVCECEQSGINDCIRHYSNSIVSRPS